MTDLSSGTIADAPTRCGSRLHRRNWWGWCARTEGHAGRHCNSTTHVSNVRYWTDDEATAYRPTCPVDYGQAHAIIAAVCAAHDVTVDELTGRSLEPWAVAARHAAMCAVRAGTLLSLPQIGRMFDRHHTTVLAVVRQPVNRQPTVVHKGQQASPRTPQRPPITSTQRPSCDPQDRSRTMPL